MSFWSAVVKPGKPHAYVPPPEEWNLHLSQASLDVTVPEGRRVSLLVRLSGGDEDGGKSEQPVVLCTLTAGRTDNMPLDLFFSQYAEFTVKVGGKGSGPGKDDDIEVHLSGYYTPAMGVDGEEGGEDEDEDEDEEYQLPDGEDEDSEDMEIPGGLEGLPKHLRALIAANAARRGLPGPEGDDEDEEGEEDEDEDEEDEDEDEDMDEDEDEEMFGFEPAVGRRKPHVVIEEVVDDEDDKKKQQQQQDKKAEAKGKKEEKKEQQQQQEKGKKENKQQQQQQQQANGDQGKAAKRQAEAPAKKDETPAKKQAAGQDQPQAKPVKQQEQKGKQEGKQQQQEGKATPAKKNIRTFENGFQVEEVSYGNPKGKLAKAGQRVSVRYVGRLKSNGKVFDKSDKKPFTFRLGVGEVIKGWDAGVEGMKVGDKRRLVIPPQMAYGSGGVRGTIPPNATLEFDVELVDVK